MDNITKKQLIPVTKPYLPQRAQINKYLDRIWDSNYLTNQGPLVTELNNKLRNYLEIDNFQFVSNGTIAMQLALEAYDLRDCEIITTPFTYVATTSAILWQGCTPVYADIEPDTLCIDPANIEKCITPRTRAIMGVHVFGFPCNIEEIQRIADKYNLKIIYDAAHAFGAQYKGKSLLGYGDISTCSFHATKLFNTVEGGSVVVHDKDIYNRIELSMRFGHNLDEHICLGINAKNSELHAMFGLCNINDIDQIISSRGEIVDRYIQTLDGLAYIPMPKGDYLRNNAYCPVIFKDENELMQVQTSLNAENIFPRRYFYPSLNKLPYVDSGDCPISESIARRILCLPLYVGLSLEDQNRIIDIIVKSIGSRC